MNKNPFSLYDFLGYLFPGLIVLLFLYFIINTGTQPIETYFMPQKYSSLFGQGENVKWWEGTVLIILFSYILGHIVAYLSSSTIEYFTNRVFEYPSHYLLHDEPLSFCTMLKRYLNGVFVRTNRLSLWLVIRNCQWRTISEAIPSINLGVLFWRFLVSVVMFPVTVCVFVFGSFSLGKFIVRPLDEYVRNSIIRKLSVLSHKLNLDDPDVNSDADYHRIVMHYVYLNIPECQRKTDNYVAIYGFLRAITLECCLFFDFLLVKEILYSIDVCATNEKVIIDMTAIWIVFGLFVLCNITYMSFVKFYRRFTLENYMALLTEKN